MKKNSNNDKNKLLHKALSSLDMRNLMIKSICFIQWRKKVKVKPKRQIVKCKRVYQHFLLKNICFNIINKIRKESNRRKLIRMFLHIRNCQTPILAKAMENIIQYSNFRYEIMNWYATYIQSYYRMKKQARGLLKITKIQKRIYSHTEYEENEDYPLYQNSQTQSTKSKHKSISNSPLNPREVFRQLARRHFIKSLVFTLMVSL